MAIPRSAWVALGCGTALFLAAALLLILLLSFRPAHQELPKPDGMVLRIELPEAEVPWINAAVRVSGEQPPRLIVTYRVYPRPGECDYVCAEYAYPSGKRLTEPVPAADIDALQEHAEFDFDGDGVVDTLQCDWTAGVHTVRVTSGVTGRGLFVHTDPREYEYEKGAFPLGDLDGDGCAELALSHPRMDRSDYDLELYDAIFGARSWITVVSGKLACAR
jgi:hypothetical protein